MRSSNAQDPDGSGGHPDQHPGDPVRRLRVPGAEAAPGQDQAASPIAPARARHRPGPGRPGGRREYDHQPGAPAASCVAPSAFTAVRDITGRPLLVRRCDTGDRELPGGHVDPGESASEAAVRETAKESGITVQVTALAGLYTDPGHVIADPRAGLVRQPFAVCFHARPLSGTPAGDQIETSDARWFTAGDIPALPIRPAIRLRIGHALTPADPATSADTGHPRRWPRRPPWRRCRAREPSTWPPWPARRWPTARTCWGVAGGDGTQALVAGIAAEHHLPFHADLNPAGG